MGETQQTLGKRKRKQVSSLTSILDSTLEEEQSDKLQAHFRQHFEASFQPLIDLHQQRSGKPKAKEEDDDNNESEWDGIPDEEQIEAQVIQYQDSIGSNPSLPSDEFRSFMNSKPPLSSSLPPAAGRRKQSETDSAEAITDAANLKKDIALQRLLKESHLLDPKSSLTPSGQNRHRAMDLRLQEMGSKSSLYHQHNMPMAQRRGIAAKAAGKEESRRKEAKENGIILEKVTGEKKRNISRRERGIGAPTIGRFKGGMLKLSKKDVVDIEGPKKSRRSRK